MYAAEDNPPYSISKIAIDIADDHNQSWYTLNKKRHQGVPCSLSVKTAQADCFLKKRKLLYRYCKNNCKY